MLALLLFLSIPAFFYLFQFISRSREEKRRRALARDLGFRYTQGMVSGRVRGTPVAIGWKSGDDYRRASTWYNLDFSHPPAFHFRLTPRKNRTKPASELISCRTGDADFDQEIHCATDDEGRLLCLLTREVRDLLLDVFVRDHLGQDFSISSRRVRVSLYDGQATEIVPRLVDLAEKLQARGDVTPGLIRNFHLDTDPRVRRRNLELLLRLFPGLPEGKALLAEALASASPELLFSVFKFDAVRRQPDFLAEIWSRSREALRLEMVAEIKAEPRFTSFLVRRYPAAEKAVNLAILEAFDRNCTPEVRALLRTQLQETDPLLAKSILHLLEKHGTLKDAGDLMKAVTIFNRATLIRVIRAIRQRHNEQGEGWLSLLPDMAEGEGGLSLDAGEGQLSLPGE